MSQPSQFLSFHIPCEQCALKVTERLASAGLQSQRTFDLRETHAFSAADCGCEGLGEDGCACQMIVLLVYWQELAPVTLILNGQDGYTCLSMNDETSNTGSMVRQALLELAKELIP